MLWNEKNCKWMGNNLLFISQFYKFVCRDIFVCKLNLSFLSMLTDVAESRSLFTSTWISLCWNQGWAQRLFLSPENECAGSWTKSMSLKSRQIFACVETRGEPRGYSCRLKTWCAGWPGQSPGVLKVDRCLLVLVTWVKFRGNWK